MKKLSASVKIYILMIIVLAISNAVQTYFQLYQETAPAVPLPASPIVIALVNVGITVILYGGLGLIGLKLAERLGFPDIWDEGVTNRKRFLVPAVVGVIGGLFVIAGDSVFAPLNGIGHFIHPPFPGSILASLSAGIGEEIMFRLFFIPFWCWLISIVILHGKRRNQVFWWVSAASAIVFALGHLPGVLFLYGFNSIEDVPPILLLEGLLLNGVIGIIAANFLRKWGFLAAAGVHFWTDIIWHVLWGAFGGLL